MVLVLFHSWFVIILKEWKRNKGKHKHLTYDHNNCNCLLNPASSSLTMVVLIAGISQALPSNLIKASLKGCILSVKLSSGNQGAFQVFDATQFVSSSVGAHYSCHYWIFFLYFNSCICGSFLWWYFLQYFFNIKSTLIKNCYTKHQERIFLYVPYFFKKRGEEIVNFMYFILTKDEERMFLYIP